MSRGPQVLDMEYREPNQLEDGPGGPIYSFFSASTLSAAATSITLAWSCSRDVFYIIHKNIYILMHIYKKNMQNVESIAKNMKT
jgi:hypothetical protein